jgi:hypothetical protein
MLRRLILGLMLGLVLGGAVAAGFVRLMGTSFAPHGGGVVALLSAALTGAVTGLVAGKPIWASGARVEAGIKAFFGALMAAGAMFALRRWGLEVPGPEILGGKAPIGELPAISLPVIAGALGGLFGLDNSPDEPAKGKKGDPPPRKRVAGADGRARAVGARLAESDDTEASDLDPRRAKR